MEVLGAIDTGSNAIRMVIANVSGSNIAILESERVPVRLGHHTFTHGELDPKTIEAAVGAYARFRARFDDYGVTRYRAVATSALRNASNREDLLDRIYREVGLEIEVIDGREEARLVRKAVLRHCNSDLPPDVILDLGGGSLEVTRRAAQSWQTSSMRIGTVRLLEMFGLSGSISEDEARMIRRLVQSSHLQGNAAGNEAATSVVASGGNAEAIAAKLKSAQKKGAASGRFSAAALSELIPQILPLSVAERVKAFGVKKDRAEVLGVASLVFGTAADVLGIEEFIAPGVGLKEGVLLDLAEVSSGALATSDDSHSVAMARAFAARMGHNTAHGEQVRRLASSLFGQLRGLHGLEDEMDVVLQLAAVLHDIGEVVHRRGHHKHGEYLILNGRIPGLQSPEREMVAAVVRGHRKSAPSSKHQAFAALDKKQQNTVKKLAALLRTADELDADRRQKILALGSQEHDDTVALHVSVAAEGGREQMLDLHKGDLFQRVFGKELTCTVSEVAVTHRRPHTAE